MDWQDNVPLAPFTTWHIGGPAEHYCCPSSWEELAALLRHMPANSGKVHFLGLGSNVLIPDEGLRGLVVHTRKLDGVIAGIETVRAEAGVTCAKLARYCVKHGLRGGAFFAGIPGTVGGALAMNAGAFGGETWARVVAVEVINRQGERKMRQPEEYAIAYRSVKGPVDEEWFVAGHFQFERGDPEQLAQDLRQLIQKRNTLQPIGVFSCGSVFMNPPGDYAARLIESCGLKGYRMGGLQVSEKHANFIVNQGGATAKDALDLIRHIQNVIQSETGIVLISEVRLLSSGGNL
jgi:UDP-N-acetylmuramate dehydrogenase